MRSRFGLDTVAAAAAAFLALALFPRPAAADHSLGQTCYVCHKLGSSSIYRGTRAIDNSKAIGLTPPVTQPLNCEFCHTDYRNEFNALAKSAHPVKLIEGAVFYVNANNNYQPQSSYAGIKLLCADCHSGDTLLGGQAPDVAPDSYDQVGKDSLTDGYPNHDLNEIANTFVVPFVPLWGSTPAAGDMPHIGIPNSPSSYIYNHKASSNPATDYSLCFYCHDGSAKTTRAVDIKSAYIAAGGGHAFKSDGVRIACLDCHDTHGSTSLYLYNRAAAPIATDANKRLICLECHGKTGRLFTDATGTGTRTINVPAPLTALAAHQGASTSACTLCHDPHNPMKRIANCFLCHSKNTAGAVYTALGGAAFTKYVDDAGGDDFAYTGTFSKHDITFADNNNAACMDCHEITLAGHANGSTNDDLKYNGPTGANWPVSTVNETGTTFGSGIEHCLGCHRGGTNFWGLTPPTIDGFMDFGPDNKSTTTGDNVANAYGQGEIAVTGYTSPVSSPQFYNALTGAGNDPPSGYTGVPLFAHYTQGATSAGTKWWQLGATATAPHPLPCMDCHYAHGAPNGALYRSPTGAVGLGSEKGGIARSICMNCHAGATTLEGRNPADPTNPRLADRYNNPVAAHAPAATQSCSSSSSLSPTGCHNAHTPSCEVCHGYP